MKYVPYIVIQIRCNGLVFLFFSFVFFSSLCFVLLVRGIRPLKTTINVPHFWYLQEFLDSPMLP